MARNLFAGQTVQTSIPADDTDMTPDFDAAAVSSGVPVNVLRAVYDHEEASQPRTSVFGVLGTPRSQPKPDRRQKIEETAKSLSDLLKSGKSVPDAVRAKFSDDATATSVLDKAAKIAGDYPDEDQAATYQRNLAYAKPAKEYQTKLDGKDEAEFERWVSQNNVPFQDGKTADYDMRGFFKALKSGDPRAATAMNSNDGMIHYPDYWKTPYHKSFSNESQWATDKAPAWNDKDQLVTPDGRVVFDERDPVVGLLQGAKPVAGEVREPSLGEDAANRFMKVAGGAVSGGGAVVRGLGDAAAIAQDAITGQPAANPLTEFADTMDKAGQAIGNTLQTPEQKAREEGSQIEGDIFDPSTWSFGKNPSVGGYLDQGVYVLGQMVPIIAGQAVGGVTGAATLGGLQGGGAADQQARQRIQEMADNGTLADESKAFRDLVAGGVPEDKAVSTVKEAAAKWAAGLTAPVSALGGAVTGAIADPLTKIASKSGVLSRVMARAAIGGVEEGSEEVAEDVATNLGTNAGAGTNVALTSGGTLADFVMGAMPGASLGAVAGAASKREAETAAPAAPVEPPAPPVAPQTVPPVPGVPVQPEAVAPAPPVGADAGAGPAFQPTADVVPEAAPTSTFPTTNQVENVDIGPTGRLTPAADARAAGVRRPETPLAPPTGPISRALARMSAGTPIVITAPGMTPMAGTVESHDANGLSFTDEAGDRLEISADELASGQVAVTPADALDTGEPAPAEGVATVDTPDSLRARLDFIAEQARSNGWNNRLIQARSETQARLAEIEGSPANDAISDDSGRSPLAPGAVETGGAGAGPGVPGVSGEAAIEPVALAPAPEQRGGSGLPDAVPADEPPVSLGYDWDKPAREAEAAMRAMPAREKDADLSKLVDEASTVGNPIDEASAFVGGDRSLSDRIDNLIDRSRQQERRIAQKYGVKVDDLESAPLNPQERHFLFYTKGPVSRENAAELRHIIEPVIDEDDAVSAMREAMGKLPKTNNLSEMNETEQAAVARLMVIGGEMDRLGLDQKKVITKALEYEAHRHSHRPDDAEFMVNDAVERIRSFLPDVEAPKAKPAPALAAPKTPAEIDKTVDNDEPWKALKPPTKGHVRFYNGTTDADMDRQGKQFVSPDPAYARNYRGGPNDLLYVDLPIAQAKRLGLYDDVNGVAQNGALPDGVAKKLTKVVSADAPQTVDESAHEAATSPTNELPDPTAAQQEAGNFKVGRVNLHGLEISVEIPKGGIRRGIDKNGKPWERELKSHYGYVRGTKSADGDHFDVYLGPKADDESLPIYVIDQNKPNTSTYDESKGMIGYASGKDARAAYDANFPAGLKVFRGIKKMSPAEFTAWLKDGDTTKPAAERNRAPVATTKSATNGVPLPPSAIKRNDGIASTAITPAGRKVAVTYAVVDMDDLVTSHDDAMGVNPAYPATMQPRDRSRAASVAQVGEIARKIEPALMIEGASAGEGAPIISPDGVVESGNGRTIALRTARTNYPDRYNAYRDELVSRGYDVSGIKAPVLVRVRNTEMTDSERSAFTREANERTTAAMSAPEQAMADARALSDETIALHRGGSIAKIENRDFAKAAIRQIASTAEQGQFFTKDGSLSGDGAVRLDRAMLAKAYGNADLVSLMTEGAMEDIRSIGGALLDTAPQWAQMRQRAADGIIRSEADQTAALVEAVQMVRRARREDKPLTLYLKTDDMFAGSVAPEVAAFASVFFSDSAFSKAAPRTRVQDALSYYVSQANLMETGPSLFGDQNNAKPADIIERARGRNRGDEQLTLEARPVGTGADGGAPRRQGEQPSSPADGSKAEGARTESGPRKLTLSEFSKERGLPTTADVDSHIHAGLRSKPQAKTYDRWNSKTLKELQDGRDEAQRLYKMEIDAGRIVDPDTLLTRRERLERTAAGHPDNSATKAARNLLAKMDVAESPDPSPAKPKKGANPAPPAKTVLNHFSSAPDDVVDAVMSAIDVGKHDVWGLRIDDGVSHAVGGYVPDSRVWVDSLPTDEDIDGTSTIGLGEEPTRKRIVKALRQLDNYLGDTLVLVGGQDRGAGEDAGERIIGKGRAELVLKKSRVATPEAAPVSDPIKSDTSKPEPDVAGPKKLVKPKLAVSGVDETTNRFETPEAMTEHLRSGRYGDLLGRLIDGENIVIKANDRDDFDTGTLPARDRIPALTTPNGRIIMYARNNSPDMAEAIALHEVMHAGVRPLVGSKAWRSMLRRARTMYEAAWDRRDDGTADPHRKFWDRVFEHIDQAGTPPEDQAEEMLAYAVMYRDMESPPAGLRALVNQIIAAVKSWALKTFGTQIGNLTPEQLHGLAVQALQGWKVGTRSVIQMTPTGLVRFAVNLNQPITPKAEFEKEKVSLIRSVSTESMPAMLWAVGVRDMLTRLGRDVQAFQDYHSNWDAMNATRAKWMKEANAIATDWKEFASLNRVENTELADMMHSATLAGVDPSKPFESDYTDEDREVVAKGRQGRTDRKWVKADQKREKHEEREKAHGDLQKRYEALPAKAKALFTTVRDFYVAMADEQDKIIAENIRKALDAGVRKAQRDHRRRVKKINDRSDLTDDERKEKIGDEDRLLREIMTSGSWKRRAKLTKLRQQYESNRLSGVYFPLARFGDLFATVRDEDGHVISFSRFENRRAQAKFAAEQKAVPGQFVEVGLLDDKKALRKQVDPNFVAEIEKLLEQAGVDGGVADSIWQRHLENMPDFSLRLQKIHRKGRAGFNADALRNFSSVTFHGGHQIARLQHVPDLVENLDDAEEQIGNIQDDEEKIRSQHLLRAVETAHEWILNPTDNPIARKLTAIGFTAFLAGRVSTALNNYTQPWTFGAGHLAAYHGNYTSGAAALRYLAKAAKDNLAGRSFAEKSKNLTDDERRALRAAYDVYALIESTNSHNLAEVAESGARFGRVRQQVAKVSPWVARQEVMQWLSFGLHHTERQSREVVFLAAYRMARDKGLEHVESMDKAAELTWRSQKDFSNAARPRLLRSGAGKVLFQFRSYQIQSLFDLFYAMHQSVKGKSPEYRKEAQIQLITTVAMMGALAGVRGTFLLAVVLPVLAGLFAGAGDDDKTSVGEVVASPFKILGRLLLGGASSDDQDKLRKMLQEAGLPPQVVGTFLDGIPGYWAGIDISSRIGMPELWFRGSDRVQQDATDWWQEYLVEAMGPAAGVGGNIARGFDMASDGNVYRGIEQAAPSVAKDLMRTYRFMMEGATTRNGDDVVDHFNPVELFAQALGYTPAILAERYRLNTTLSNAQMAVTSKRSNLLAALWRARRDGDSDEAIQERIREYNEQWPEYAITNKTIRQSFKSRQRASDRNEGGIALNPKLNDRLRDSVSEPTYGD